MAARSAGILLYRDRGGSLEVLIVHMGGPLWARKDEHAWSIPKGEYEEGEDPYDAAHREFAEELGQPVPRGEPIDLGEVRQSGGKRVHAWAIAADLEPSNFVSNTFTTEWPRGSGTIREFPEIDRVEWSSIDLARSRLVKAQSEFLDRLVTAVSDPR